MKFSWRLVALTSGGALSAIAVACGGADTTVQPRAVQPASAAAAPTPTTPSPLPTAPSPPAAAEDAFAWEIDDVDAGTKPALALTGDDVPYLAYMQEDQHGFVKNAVLSGGSWDITTVAEGYFYGPLDIAVGPDDVAHITYHDHAEQQFEPAKGDAAYAVLARIHRRYDVTAAEWAMRGKRRRWSGHDFWQLGPVSVFSRRGETL